MTILGEYLAAFEGDKPTQPSQSGLVKKPVLELQRILNALGWSTRTVNPDGDYGPAGRKAWDQSARKRKLNPAFDRAGPREAWVHPQTYSRLSAQAGTAPVRPAPAPTSAPAPAPKPAAAPSPAPTGGRLVPFVSMPQETVSRPERIVNAPLKTIQTILNKLGWRTRTVRATGRYDANTAMAWGKSSSSRKLDPYIKDAGGGKASVSMATYLKLKAEAGMKAKPVAGVVQMPVMKVQKAYNQMVKRKELKGPIIDEDGDYGPQTVKAVQTVAAKYGRSPIARRVERNVIEVEKVVAEKLDYAYLSIPGREAPPPVPEPSVTPWETLAPGKTVEIPVVEVQTLLRKLGFSEKAVKTSGHYDKPTEVAWKLTAQKYGLNGMIWPTTAGKARVIRATYDRFRKITAKPVVKAVQMPVEQIQKGYNWWVFKKVFPKPLLKPTGKVNDKTVTAVKGASKILKVSPFALMVSSTVMGVHPKLKKKLEEGYAASEAQKAREEPKPVVVPVKPDRPAEPEPVKPAPVKPPPVKPVPEWKKLPAGTTKKVSVAELQKIMHGLGLQKTKATTDGKYGPTTTSAWAGYAKKNKMRPSIWRVNLYNARVIADTYEGLKRLATMAPPGSDEDEHGCKGSAGYVWCESLKKCIQPWMTKCPPVAAGKSEARSIAEGLLKQPTASVLVLNLQQALLQKKVGKGVAPSGVFDEPTRKGIVQLLAQGDKQKEEIWTEYTYLAVSKNKKSIALPSTVARAVGILAQQYLAAQIPKPDITVPEPAPTPAPAPIAPAPEPEPVAMPEPTPGPEPEPMPAPAPIPGPAPEPAPMDLQTWDRLVEALSLMGTYGEKINEEIQKAAETTGLSDQAKEAYTAWTRAGERLRQRLAQFIEQNPELQQAIDAAAPSAGFSGVTGLGEYGAYFEQVVSASAKAVELLRQAFPPVGKALEGLGQWQAGLWTKFLQVLRSRTVATVGATGLATWGLSGVFNKEVDSYHEWNAKVLDLISEGKLSPEEGKAYMKEPPKKIGFVVPVVAGVVALGAFALLLQQKKES